MVALYPRLRFSSLMDIDKLIPTTAGTSDSVRFSSLMDIDKLIHTDQTETTKMVLVLCWTLTN